MTVSFNIEYRTNWGEEVKVQGSVPELGMNDADKAVTLHTVDGIHWDYTGLCTLRQPILKRDSDL